MKFRYIYIILILEFKKEEGKRHFDEEMQHKATIVCMWYIVVVLGLGGG